MQTIRMRKSLYLLLLLPILLADSATTWAADWPQFQGNSQRTGYTADSIAPPYRVRWMWLGPNTTLKNKASNAAWPDDLTSRTGYNFPMPSSVPMTLSGPAQPIVSGTKVFISDQQGSVYGINLSDGSTAWTQPLPGGTINTGAAVGTVVVYASITGYVRGYNMTDGAIQWTVQTGRAITAAVLEHQGTIYVGDHGGKITAINPVGGAVLWTKTLPAPIQGTFAASGGFLYVGAENMVAYRIDTANPTAAPVSRAVTGQSFRMTWPAITGGYAFFQTVPIPCVGSEGTGRGEDVCAAATDMANEQARWLDYQAGLGGYTSASPDWEHLHALNLTTMNKPFRIGCGPSNGCGEPPESVVVDKNGRPICYWKTKYPKLTKLGVNTVPSGGNMFGTNYSMDLSAISTTDGSRIVIRDQIAGCRLETDNQYALSVGGDYIFMRQRFRGTQCINMTTSAYRYIQQQSKFLDGGTYTSDIMYDCTSDSAEATPTVPQRVSEGRCPTTISGTVLLIADPYCVTAIEHY